MMDYKKKIERYNKFKEELQNYFETQDGEWVHFYVSHSGRVDLRIVSDQFENREKAMQFINKNIEELGRWYRKGLISYHTVAEAELLDLIKPQEREVGFTWEKAAISYINQDTLFHKNKHELKIASFYSYKGGVGRTVALTHIAYLLAKRGKNVLLIDLDIEAPSFFNVFESQLDVEYGLVDYLYEKVMESEKEESKIKITDIFTEIRLNETLKGSIYVIPAGRLSPEYIFKLTQLQPTIISKKDYMSNLILELKDMLKIDIVLIDSRTGINEWGAFSLLDVSDEVIFFAYPNKENISGLKVIMELMGNVGRKNITTVFSRIDPKGNEIANSLFEELGLESDQEPIFIPYETSIAIGTDFPITAALDQYQRIADFLLEDEQIKINTEYLTQTKRDELLNNFQKGNDVFSNLLKEKIQKNKWFIIDTEDVLNEYIFKFLKHPKKSIFTSYINKNEEREVLTDEEESKDLLEVMYRCSDYDYTSIWLAYFLFILSSNKESDFKRGLLVLISEIKNSIESEKLSIFKDAIVFFSKETRVVLSDISWINNLRENSVECLKGLLECVKFLSQINHLDIKILVTRKLFDQFKEIFNEIKGNYLELVWNKGDIIDIVKNLCFWQLNDMQDYARKLNSFNPIVKLKSDGEIFSDNTDEIIENNLNDSLGLFWGIRVIPGKYSKPMSDWFYEQLQKDGGTVNPLRVLNILKRAMEIELNKDFTITDRLISLESLKSAFKMEKEETNKVH